MVMRNENNVSIFLVVMGVGNLVRVNINSDLSLDCQFVAVMTKPLKFDSIIVQHIITITRIPWHRGFYLNVILGCNFWICNDEIVFAQAYY